jgi:hypothetical protein
MTNRNKSVSGSRPNKIEPFARIHPQYDTGPGMIDPYKTQIPIVLKDGSNVTAVRVDGRWSIKERPEIPARRHSRGIYGYIEILNSLGFSRPGAKARFAVEDRFYFGQPERFADVKASDLYALHNAIGKRAIAAYKNGPDSLAAKYDSWIEEIQDLISLAKDGKQDLLKKYARGLPSELRKMLPASISFARKRTPARYTTELDFSDASEQAETSKNDDMAEMLKQAEISLQTMTKEQGRGLTAKRFLQYAEGFLHPKTPSALREKLNRLKQAVMALPEMKHPFSSPGQPERFDASSLERGNFAEASKSPMLGKLLAAKAMPDGGWRAVQAGSDTLVISFEDADLARDFGRRVASKGYNATSPVATTGRYWNVEVKNG